MKTYFLREIKQKYIKMSSAAVVIGALRIYLCAHIYNKRTKMALYRSTDYQINWPFGSEEEVQIGFPR